MHIGIDASRAFVSQVTGTENYSLNLIRALLKIDRKNHYTLYIKEHKRNMELVLSSGAAPSPNYKFKVIPLLYLWTQVGLAWECLKNPPDVLFIPAHTLPVIRRPKLPVVVTIHDLGAEFLPQYHQFPQKLYLNKSTEYAVRHAHRIIAVSESTKKDLITKLHCDPEKISVIYEGIDREKFKVQPSSRAQVEGSSKFKVSKIKKKYGIVGDYLLFVGTVQPRKNLVRLIEAFSLAIKQFSNLAISLLIVGKPGWLDEEIYEAPKKFGVEGKVKFLDYVSDEDLPFLYQNALCFVLPSLYEGFGLPILEAMACGCPVVASKTSSLPEVVGEAGILVDPDDVLDIAKNLQLVLGGLQLRKTLIKRGLEQVKNFSWEKCAKETLVVLEKAGRKQ